MEVVNTRNAILSNFEVYSLLQGITKQEKKKGKSFTQRGLADIAYDTIKYLETTPCRSQTPESIQEFLKALMKHGININKSEKLQLINLRPTTPVEMQLIIEDSEERLTEEQIEILIGLVQQYLPEVSTQNGT